MIVTMQTMSGVQSSPSVIELQNMILRLPIDTLPWVHQLVASLVDRDTQAYLMDLRDMPIDPEDAWVKTTAENPEGAERLRKRAQDALLRGETLDLDDVLAGRA